MKKLVILIAPLAVLVAGCTTVTLDRHTLSQSQSVADYRYQATLHALAMVAADPETLPSYSLLSNGIATVTDTGIANPITSWFGSAVRFAYQSLAFTGSHAPQALWTVSPVADYTQLEAMRCACRCVLPNIKAPGPDCVHLLADPELDWTPGAHFGVAGRLARLPQGWLHVGRFVDMPPEAIYRDHCGDSWVWVTREGTAGLAGFTLVLQDIATLLVAPTDGTSPSHMTPPLVATLWTYESVLTPIAPIVDININDGDGGDVRFAKVSDPTQSPIEIVVGQQVVWHNHTKKQQALSSPFFNPVTISAAGDSQQMPFDQPMYAKAGGLPGGYVSIPVIDAGGLNPLTTELKLTTDPNRSAYSPAVAFRMDRLIKPEFKSTIERKMKDGIATTASSRPVAISWENWMAWTTPYQGQRNASKPGAPTMIPATQPPGRATPRRGTGIPQARGFVALPLLTPSQD